MAKRRPVRKVTRAIKGMDAKEVLFDAEGFLSKPSIKIGQTVKYIAMISVIPALIGLIATYVGLSGRLVPLPVIQLQAMLGISGLEASIATFVFTIIGAVVSMILWGIILHIACKIVGGTKNFNDTLNAVAASMTPMLLLGWVPFIQILAAIQGLVILVNGLAKKQSMSIFEASLAVALPIILIALVGIFVLVSIPVFIPLQFFA